MNTFYSLLLKIVKVFTYIFVCEIIALGASIVCAVIVDFLITIWTQKEIFLIGYYSFNVVAKIFTGFAFFIGFYLGLGEANNIIKKVEAWASSRTMRQVLKTMMTTAKGTTGQSR